MQEKTHKYKVLLAGGGTNQETSLLLNKSCLGQNLDYGVQFCSHLKNENWKGSEKDFGADWSMWNDLHMRSRWVGWWYLCVKEITKGGCESSTPSQSAQVDGVNFLFHYESCELLNKANGVSRWKKGKEFTFQGVIIKCKAPIAKRWHGCDLRDWPSSWKKNLCSVEDIDLFLEVPWAENSYRLDYFHVNDMYTPELHLKSW